MKKLKREWRKEMHVLMLTDKDWYKKEDTETFRRIRELADLLSDIAPPPREFDKEKYLELEKKGMMKKDIADYFRVSQIVLKQWRNEHGLP